MNHEMPPMMRQVESIPALYREMNGEFEARAQRLLEDRTLLSLNNLIFTGCGDSYCAAQVGAGLFERFTDMRCVCKTSIDLAWIEDIRRWTSGERAAALVGISVSGEVTRIAEALLRVTQHNGTAIAVTGNQNSCVGRGGTHLLNIAIPPFPFAPGVRSYCASVLMMTHLAVCWGEARGTLPPERARALRDAVRALPDVLLEAMPRLLQESRAAAKMLEESANFEFIGAGLSYFSGWFGMAKILETLGSPTAACNSEDWFHMQYFTKELSGTSTCVLTHGTGLASRREEELLHHAKTMGRKIWAVTDRNDLTQYPCIHIPRLAEETLLPLVEPLPLAAIASELCELCGEQYMRGAEGPWAPCAGCALIANGEIRLPRQTHR